MAISVLAVIFYIFYQEWISLYLLFIVILFPFFSLAVSLPAMLSAGLALTVMPETLFRAKTGTVTLTACLKGRIIPLRRMECVLRRENLLTGETELSRPVFRAVSKAQLWEKSFSADHCGLHIFRAEAVRVYDLSGLFFHRVTPPDMTVCMVNPIEAPPHPTPILPDGTEGQSALTLRRGGVGEDYDLRDYRPGDALRSIHWKLTAKADKPMVKESLEQRQPRMVLSFDLRGTDSELDATFDQLVWLSRQMLQRGHPHVLSWLDPDSGMPEERAVTDERDLQDCLILLFSAPVPQKRINDSAEGAAGGRVPDWQYHVMPHHRALEENGGGEG